MRRISGLGVIICSALTLVLIRISPAMTLDIVSIEQPEHYQVLKTKAKPVKFPLTKDTKELILAMKNRLNELGGVGLAAPQVNHPQQIIAIYIPEEASLLRDNVTTYPMHILINPTYLEMPEASKHSDFEACYSVKSKAGKVPRYKQIKLTYFDETGQFHEQIAEGFYARVLQHEVDHLNGVLITDRLTPDCVQGTMEEMMALRRAELPEEKKKLFDQIMAKKNKR